MDNLVFNGWHTVACLVWYIGLIGLAFSFVGSLNDYADKRVKAIQKFEAAQEKRDRYKEVA